jgi:hypothetical protein
MKLTKTRLKKIIKEELETVLAENPYKNDPAYVIDRIEGGVPVYRRKDVDQQGRPINPDIGEQPKIRDNEQNVMNMLMKIDGMDQKRAKQISSYLN